MGNNPLSVLSMYSVADKLHMYVPGFQKSKTEERKSSIKLGLVFLMCLESSLIMLADVFIRICIKSWSATLPLSALFASLTFK